MTMATAGLLMPATDDLPIGSRPGGRLATFAWPACTTATVDPPDSGGVGWE